MARRNDGKMDKRTTEYKDAAARMKKARAAAGKQRSASPKSAARAKASGPRRADGKLDQRTSEGRAMAERMAAIRTKRGKGTAKGFFTWIFGG
jgi:hypothetical protein